VKNNLQTISSLLRLQARRFESEAVGSALEEAVRRITAISLVHETLAQDAEGDQAWFNEIVRPLVRMMEEGLASPERPVRFEVHGDAGRLPARLAMPLAVVLAELLQNAVDHAFPTDGGTVRIDLDHDAESVRLRVVDDGVGIPEGFDPTSTSGLGMMIVRTFVEADLRGSISIRRGPDDGPDRSERPGTVIDLVVPVEVEASVS
jgi:two-component sensor histidine kinase